MPLFDTWSPVGVAALVAIAAGIVLLLVYAVQRGLVHRELAGIETDAVLEPEAPAPTPPTPVRSRTLGTAGAVLLVVGLGLGVVAAVASWTSPGTGGPPGGGTDCAQSWSGCPKDTPRP